MTCTLWAFAVPPEPPEPDKDMGTGFDLTILVGKWVSYFDGQGRERLGQVVGTVGQQYARIEPASRPEVVRVERGKLIAFAAGPSAFASPSPNKRRRPKTWLNGYAAKRAPKEG